MNKTALPKKYKSSVYVISYVLIGTMVFSVFEIGARLRYGYQQHKREEIARSRIVTKDELDIYERPDPNKTYNWLLVPNFKITIGEMIKLKEKSGHWLAVNVLRSKIKKTGDKDKLYVSINSDGFKGPEISQNKFKTRLLILGDSCTFGLLSPYARVLESQLHNQKLDVEIINAGVEGYSPINILARIEEFKNLKPQITTIYIGWNSLWGDQEFRDSWETNFYSLRLFNDSFEKFKLKIYGLKNVASQEYAKQKTPKKESLDVLVRNDYYPSFMNDVEKIIREMQSVGSDVVILTLPGLYVMEEAPTPKALEMGHLPTFTDNPYVLAKMTERYNFHLKKLAKKYNLQVIDLDQWSREGLSPRDYYFFDSVHFDDEGSAKVGTFIAEQLTQKVSQFQSKKTETQ